MKKHQPFRSNMDISIKCIWCRKDKLIREFYKHGAMNLGVLHKCKNCCRAFSVWQKIISRCYNAKAKDYCRYGERGIYVCEEWQYSKNFLAWYFDNYIEGHQVDRRDNNGPYSPDNCRIVSPRENARNRSSSVLNEEILHTIDLMLCSGLRLFEIAKELGIHRTTISSALHGHSWTDFRFSDYVKGLHRRTNV